MQQLTYVSTARQPIGPEEAAEILVVSRRNNGAADLTGLLIHDGRRFLQALEGPEAAVKATIERIKADPRHRSIVILGSREIEEREFGEWAMASTMVDTVEEGRTLADTVAALVAQVPNANVRALFTSFAKIDRSAA